MPRKINLFALLLLVPMLSQAATIMSSSVDSSAVAKKKPLGISLGATFNTSTDKPDSYHHRVSADFSLGVNYTFSNKLKLSGSLAFDKGLDGLREESFRDASVGLSREIMKSKNVLSLTASLGVILPTNQDKRELDGFRGGAKVGSVLSYKFDKVGLKGFSASWTLGFTRNFYKFTSNREGDVNAQAALGNSLGLGYALSEKWSLAFSFGNTHAWSYSTERLNDKFSMTQSIAYQVNKNFVISGGHTNMANSFQANGTDSNIELYDPLNSTVYVSAGLTY